MSPDKTFAAYLLNLEDDSFFSVYRNYLGPIQTPYNKHDLIQDLHDFLIRPATAERIRTLLSRDDRVILSAISVLTAPSEEQLFRFLAAEFDYATIQRLILNLKDRLLVIDGARHDEVRINPIVAPALAPVGLGARYLVSGRSLDGANATERPVEPWMTPLFLASVYAFLREYPEPFTRNGGLRKRTAAALRERFATVPFEDYGRFLTFAVNACETLELVTVSGSDGTVTLRHESWERFSELPERWVRALVWASPLADNVERAFAYADLIFDTVGRIPGDRAYRVGEMIRILQLGRGGMDLPVDRDTVERLALVGLLLPVADEPEPTFRINPTVPPLLEADATAGIVRVQANLEVSVPPGAPFAESFVVARISHLRRYDTVPTFELTEASVTDARRNGVEAPFEQLTAIAGELPQNVRFLLKRWDSRAQAVRLLSGLVLTAAEEEAAILRRADAFSEILREELAPGVFLLHTEDSAVVERILNRLEIGAAPQVETAYAVDIEVPEYRRYLRRYHQPMLPATTIDLGDYDDTGERGDRPDAETAVDAADARSGTTDIGSTTPGPASDQTAQRSAIRDELHAVVDSVELGEDVRQELSLRIDRGLILFPEQIRAEVVPQFGIEVRGLDYLGKIRMIEQAISTADLLEVIMRSGSGDPQRLLVYPREVVESGSDLMLRAIEEPGGRAIKIRIRRISLLRRLSGTLISRNRKAP